MGQVHVSRCAKLASEMNQGKNNFGFLWPEYTRPGTENPNMGFDDLKKKEEKKSSWQFSFFQVFLA